MLSASKLYQSLSTCGPSATREAEVGEDRGDLVHHLADRVDRALRRPAAAAGSRRPTRRATRASSAASASRARASASASVRSSLSAFSAGPAVWRSSGAMAPSAAHQPRDLALLAERGEPHLLERRLVGGGGDRGQVLLAQAGDVVHASRASETGRRLPQGGAIARRRPGAGSCWIRLNRSEEEWIDPEEPRPEPAKARHCLAPVRRPERASAEAEGGRASPSAGNPRAPDWRVRESRLQGAGRWSAPLSLDRVRRRF